MTECPIKIDPYKVNTIDPDKINRIFVKTIDNSKEMKMIECIIITLLNLISFGGPYEKINDNVLIKLDYTKFNYAVKIHIKDFYKSNNTKIDLFKIFNNVIIKAKSKIPLKNLFIEYTISKKINELRTFIPNFSYTYGLININSDPYSDRIYPNNYYILSEMIDGKTLDVFLNERIYKDITKTKLNENLEILFNFFIQICFALEIAQRKFNFTHYNLDLKNIIITKSNKSNYDVVLDNIVYNINCNEYLVKIIDFSNSVMTIDSKTIKNDSIPPKYNNCIPGFDLLYLNQRLKKFMDTRGMSIDFYTFNYALNLINPEYKSPINYIQFLSEKYNILFNKNVKYYSLNRIYNSIDPLISFEYIYNFIFNIRYEPETEKPSNTIIKCLGEDAIPHLEESRSAIVSLLKLKLMNIYIESIEIKYILKYKDYIKYNYFFLLRNDLKLLKTYNDINIIEQINFNSLNDLLKSISLIRYIEIKKDVKLKNEVIGYLDIIDNMYKTIMNINFYIEMYKMLEILSEDYVSDKNLRINIKTDYEIFIINFKNSKQYIYYNKYYFDIINLYKISKIIREILS
jgi:hypothetical protein